MDRGYALKNEVNIWWENNDFFTWISRVSAMAPFKFQFLLNEF